MEKLKRVSSMFTLGRNKSRISANFQDPILEEATDQNDWPLYDPMAFETSQDFPSQAQRSPYTEQTNLTPRRSNIALPGAPPDMFDEWNLPLHYRTLTPTPAQTPGATSRVWPEISGERRDPFQESHGSFEYDTIPRRHIQTPRSIPKARLESFQARHDLLPELDNTSDISGLESIYGRLDVPLYGLPYGFSVQSPTVFRAEPPNIQEEVFRSAVPSVERSYITLKSSTSPEPLARKVSNSHVERAYITLQSANGDRSRASGVSTTIENAYQTLSSASLSMPAIETMALDDSSFRSPVSPASCIICTEDFSNAIKPPGWISLACLHEPSVCTECLAKSIKSDLESKIWNQIKCPECSTLLIYDDIKRLADPETFSRYEVMSFRSAVGGEDNFVWCRGCDFGQLHESGASQPIIRCLRCGLRSCFVHSVEWHDRLTCEEYDEMLRNPDGFQSAIDREEEAGTEARRLQLEEDERFAQELDDREKQAEQERQRQRHELQLRRARAEQEAEADRRKREQEDRRAEQRRERERLEEENRRAKAKQDAEAARKRDAEAARRKQEQDRLNARQEIKRKQREEQLSMQIVQSTTKKCPGPGCGWPIEKNDGCDHMTYMNSVGAVWTPGDAMVPDIAVECAVLNASPNFAGFA